MVEKNIEILQKEYFKAIVNLTAKEFNLEKAALNKLLEKNSCSNISNE